MRLMDKVERLLKILVLRKLRELENEFGFKEAMIKKWKEKINFLTLDQIIDGKNFG